MSTTDYNKIITTVNSITPDYTFIPDSNNVIVIDTSNNRIGINTVNPEASIHVSGGTIITDNLIVNNLDGDSSFNSNVDISNQLIVNGDSSFNSNVDISNQLVVNGTASFNGDVSFNSNVDISENLYVNGDVSFQRNLDVAGDISAIGSITAGSLLIGSVNILEAELETIDGITAGTAAASKALVLDSNKDIATIRNLTIDGVFTDGNYTFDTTGNVAGLGVVECDRVEGNGNNIDIMASNNINFYIGSTRYWFVNNNGNFQTSNNRDIYCHTIYYNAANPSSDDRLKHNEVDISGLEIIRQLKPQTYQKTSEKYPADYRGDISGEWNWETGLIAQDILKINDISYSVGYNSDKDIHYLNYNNIFVYGLQATKELDKTVQEQQNTITDLNNQVVSLMQQNQIMKVALNQLLTSAGLNTV